MEVIEQRKDGRRRRREEESPQLVFVHGSYHAAWCWAEHWLPFFSSSGYDSYAISLLGQTHASDIADFIESNLSSLPPPVLMGHSFGGLIVQYYLANIVNKQSLGKANSQNLVGAFGTALEPTQ